MDAIDMEDNPQARAALRLALKNLETDEEKAMQEIILKISSQVVASNLDDFAANVKAEIAKIKTDLTTDEDFAAAER